MRRGTREQEAPRYNVLQRIAYLVVIFALFPPADDLDGAGDVSALRSG